jgi:hypothetical protein
VLLCFSLLKILNQQAGRQELSRTWSRFAFWLMAFCFSHFSPVAGCRISGEDLDASGRTDGLMGKNDPAHQPTWGFEGKDILPNQPTEIAPPWAHRDGLRGFRSKGNYPLIYYNCPFSLLVGEATTIVGSSVISIGWFTYVFMFCFVAVWPEALPSGAGGVGSISVIVGGASEWFDRILSILLHRPHTLLPNTCPICQVFRRQ